MAKKKTPPKPKATDPVEIPGEDEELQEFDGGIIVPVRKKNQGGRPTSYRHEYAKIAGIMLRRGATISELADAFGVSNRCIHFWQSQHEEFFQQFLQLSEGSIARAERSLADRAAGYTFDAVKVFNNKGVPVIVQVREHVPPDISAIKYLLTAKRPKEWQVKDTVEVTGDDVFREIFIKMGSKKGE